MVSSSDKRKQQKLAEAKRKTRNARAKIARLKDKGIHIDPITDPTVGFRQLAEFTAKELTSYVNSIDKFTARENRFVGGAGGVAIPQSKVDIYNSLQEKYNAKVAQRMSSKGKIFLPDSGMTIEQRLNNVLPDSIRALGEVNEMPFVRNMDVKPENIKNIDKMISSLRKKLKQDYMPKLIEYQREQAYDMLKLFGNKELTDRVSNLTENQFDILFNLTSFANDSSKYYHILKAGAAQAKNAAFANLVEDGVDELLQTIEWAEKLPRGQKGARKPRS